MYKFDFLWFVCFHFRFFIHMPRLLLLSIMVSCLSVENFALSHMANQSTWRDFVTCKAVDAYVIDDSSCMATDDGDYNPCGPFY